MNTLKKEKIYTIDDIYSLPDGERAELVDGQIYYMAPPNRLHQKISGYLHNEIYNYIKIIMESVKFMLLHLLYFWIKIVLIMLNLIYLLFVI